MFVFLTVILPLLGNRLMIVAKQSRKPDKWTLRAKEKNKKSYSPTIGNCQSQSILW